MSLTANDLREVIDYDPEEGIFTWKERDIRWFTSNRQKNAWNAKFSGKRAGTVRQVGVGYTRRHISVFKKVYSEHSLAFLYMKGRWPSSPIDHIDRDATNNSWSNIKESSSSDNSKNMSKKVTNTSGVTGVSWCKVTGKWSTKVTVNREVFRLGLFENIRDAEKTVKDFRQSRGFSDDHGEELSHYRRDAHGH